MTALGIAGTVMLAGFTMVIAAACTIEAIRDPWGKGRHR